MTQMLHLDPERRCIRRPAFAFTVTLCMQLTAAATSLAENYVGLPLETLGD